MLISSTYSPFTALLTPSYIILGKNLSESRGEDAGVAEEVAEAPAHRDSLTDRGSILVVVAHIAIVAEVSHLQN